MSKLSFNNTPEHIKRAQTLRKQGPMVERLLWNALCETRKETKLKFRRQHPIYPYITDFACVQAKLIVELDGISHDSRQNYDAQRELYLHRKGWTILRFANKDVEQNLEGIVLMVIRTPQEKLLRALP